MPDLILIVKAVVLGLVEGLTEFLPVSSTGHLILAGEALKFEGRFAALFDVVIQAGAMLAVVWIYRARFFKVASTLHRDAGSRKFMLLLIVAFVPAAVVGLLGHGFIKERLFNSQVVAASLIAGGVVMLIVERLRLKEKVFDVDNMNWKDALRIGLFQCFSLVPGVSRSGATIIGGMLGGLDRKTAAEFSFFLAVPTLTAAALYDLYKNWSVLTMENSLLILIGLVSSFIFGLLAVATLIRLLVQVGFTPFAFYRIILGAIILWAV